MLAIALLNYADDEGYFMASPALIRGQLFPFLDSSKTIPGSIQELSSAGYLELSEGIDGRQVGRIVNFDKHQRVDKPKPSSIKELWQFHDASTTHPRRIHDASTEEGKGTGKGNGRDLPPAPKGERLTARLQASAEKQKAIAEIYSAYPKKVGKPAAMKAIAKALLAVDSPTLLQKTTDFATAVDAWPMDDRRFVPHPATWFNQERYNDDPAEWTRLQPANFTASRNGPPPKAEAPRRIYTQHPEPAGNWRGHPAVVALYDGGFTADVQWDTLPMEGQIEIIEAIAQKETTP